METEGSWKFPPPVPILSYNNPVHALNPTSWKFILILSFHLCLILLSGLFPSGFPTKTICATLISSIRLHAPPVSFISVWCTEQYLVRNTNHYAPRYIVVSTPLTHRPSEAKIFSSASFSQTHSAYVPPSMWATMFHTHTDKKQNYISDYLNLHVFWIANWKKQDFCTVG